MERCCPCGAARREPGSRARTLAAGSPSRRPDRARPRSPRLPSAGILSEPRLAFAAAAVDNRSVRAAHGLRLGAVAAVAICVLVAAIAALGAGGNPTARLAGCNVFPAFKGAANSAQATDQTA